MKYAQRYIELENVGILRWVCYIIRHIYGGYLLRLFLYKRLLIIKFYCLISIFSIYKFMQSLSGRGKIAMLSICAWAGTKNRKLKFFLKNTESIFFVNFYCFQEDRVIEQFNFQRKRIKQTMGYERHEQKYHFKFELAL